MQIGRSNFLSSFSINLLLVIPPILWGGNFVVGRYIGTEISAPWLNLLRWSVALAVLLPFALRDLWKNQREIRADFPRLILLSMLGVIGSNTATYSALQSMSASQGSTVYALTPFFIIVLKSLYSGTVPSSRVQLAAIISLIGIAIARNWSPDELSITAMQPVWMMVLAALCWASYCVLLSEFCIRSSPLSSFIVQILIGVALQGTVVFLIWGPLDTNTLSGNVILGVSYLGVFAAALAFLIWNIGLRHTRVRAAGVFMNLVPVSGLIFAWVFLSEDFESHEIAGILLVSSGIALSWRETSFQAAKSMPPAKTVKPFVGQAKAHER